MWKFETTENTKDYEIVYVFMWNGKRLPTYPLQIKHYVVHHLLTTPKYIVTFRVKITNLNVN